MFGDDKSYKFDVFSDILNKLLILHAEHDQNCSTATVRNIASSGGDIYSAISCGILAFKGKLHGGASQYVPEMYEEILQNNIDIDQYVDKKIKNKERLLGFGHRVYTCWDPRAKIMFDLLNSSALNFSEINAYKDVALKLIKRTSEDTFFKIRGIFPNPDLLNCILFKLIGVPSEMNTVFLSLSRVVGWLAHYCEHIQDKLPIVRPRQIPKVRFSL